MNIGMIELHFKNQILILKNVYFKSLCKNILFIVSASNCVRRSLMVQPALLKLLSLATVVAGIEKINRANIANFGNMSRSIFQNLRNQSRYRAHYLSYNHPVLYL